MNRVLTCVGAYAEAPFYMDRIFVNVYSIEELCYVLYENAFLLDKEILDRNLAVWIEKELKLPDLARELHLLINSNSSASAFVGTILSYAGYYTKDEIAHAEGVLRINVSMNAFERLKARADFLIESRHFVLALKEYDNLLRILPEEEIELKSKILNNMGIAYMNLYLYDSAEKCFLLSYECNNDEAAHRHYLLVKRMSLPEKEYINFIADSEKSSKLPDALETEFAAARNEYDTTEVAENLNKLFSLRDTTDVTSYYGEMRKLSEKLKEEYRDIVLDNEKYSSGTEIDE